MYEQKQLEKEAESAKSPEIKGRKLKIKAFKPKPADPVTISKLNIKSLLQNFKNAEMNKSILVTEKPASLPRLSLVQPNADKPFKLKLMARGQSQSKDESTSPDTRLFAAA